MGGGIVALLIIALAVAIAVAAAGWDRYRHEQSGPVPGAHPTNEVFIDPETGRRMRVWFDPRTGNRDYRED